MVSCVVWYNVLYIINKVSKILQSPKVSIETMKREISAVIDFLQDFREHGFNAAKIDAREIAEKTEVEMIWPEVRQKKTKRQFDYEGTEETTSTAEEHFRREFFLHLVDTALATTRERFSYMQDFFKLYGFLYSTEMMKSTVQGGSLDECCNRFEKTMDDVDAGDLKMEITGAVRSFPPQISSPLEILNYIYKENLLDLYPNLSIALRLLLTLPVTAASGERSFSTLKRLKTYLRSTMSQERPSSLAVISIEHEIVETLDTDSIITRFAEAKAHRERLA